jgi:tRNA(Ile)-lysidine synthase
LASAASTVRQALGAAAARLPELFAPGTRLVVGFSGGQDSSCLLHALSRPRLRLAVVAAHVDHALRPDSAAAAARVEAAAAAIGVACQVRRVDVPGYRAGLPAWGVQQAARAARYHALVGVTREHDAAALLVAHTADDQAETLLLNLLRGSGLTGLGGMPLDETLDPGRLGPPPQALSARTGGVRLARPLLRVSRATTLAYCAEAGLTVIEDASNQSRDFARNRVRLDLLPALEGYNPAIRDVLARTADLVAEDLAALEAVVEGLYAGVVRGGGRGQDAGQASSAAEVVELDLAVFRGQPRGLQRRLLRRALRSLLGSLVDVRASPIEDALDLIRSGTPSQTYHLPHGVELCIGSETFLLRMHGKARHRTRRNTWDSQVPRL